MRIDELTDAMVREADGGVIKSFRLLDGKSVRLWRTQRAYLLTRLPDEDILQEGNAQPEGAVTPPPA